MHLTKQKKSAVIFTMRYPDDAGYVWNTIAQSRDVAASHLLTDATSFIAYPKLTGSATYTSKYLSPVELDCYDYSEIGLSKIVAFIKKNNVKVIVFMSALPSTINLKALSNLGVKTVNTENDSFDSFKRDMLPVRFLKFFMRKLLKRQLHTMHLANAKSQMKFLSEYAMIPNSRLGLVRDGIDCSRFKPGDRQAARQQLGFEQYRFLIICVAQARSEKRLDFIIKAAKKIVDQRPDEYVGFLYVGDGPPVAEWKKLVDELGLTDRFKFAGRQNDLVPYYQASDLMVHAAERESFGLAIVEGMACGLPTVASAAAGPKETILDGQTGLLIDIDDFDGFINGVLRYIDDKDLTQQHGRNAHEHAVRSYSIERQGAEMAAHIVDLIK